jgi:hypothetical protein
MEVRMALASHFFKRKNASHNIFLKEKMRTHPHNRYPNLSKNILNIYLWSVYPTSAASSPKFNSLFSLCNSLSKFIYTSMISVGIGHVVY